MDRIELLFRAVPETNALHPAAVRVGRNQVIGKRFDRSAFGHGWVCTGETERVVLAGDDLHADKTHLRELVLQGALLCADSATADALEVALPAPAALAPKPFTPSAKAGD